MKQVCEGTFKRLFLLPLIQENGKSVFFKRSL